MASATQRDKRPVLRVVLLPENVMRCQPLSRPLPTELAYTIREPDGLKPSPPKVGQIPPVRLPTPDGAELLPAGQGAERRAAARTGSLWKSRMEFNVALPGFGLMELEQVHQRRDCKAFPSSQAANAPPLPIQKGGELVDLSPRRRPDVPRLPPPRQVMGSHARPGESVRDGVVGPTDPGRDLGQRLPLDRQAPGLLEFDFAPSLMG